MIDRKRNEKALAALFRSGEVLCRSVASQDLGRRPLYLLSASEVQEIVGPASEVYGFTGEYLDLALRGHIGTRWCGRGLCMVIHDAALAEAFPAPKFEAEFRSVVLHELAHVVLWETNKLRYLQPESAEAVAPARELTAEEINIGADAVQQDEMHGARFKRALAHLRYRSRLLGWRIGTVGAEDDAELAELLADELRQCSCNSIASILQTPAPAAFAEQAMSWAEWREMQGKARRRQGDTTNPTNTPGGPTG